MQRNQLAMPSEQTPCKQSNNMQNHQNMPNVTQQQFNLRHTTDIQSTNDDFDYMHLSSVRQIQCNTCRRVAITITPSLRAKQPQYIYQYITALTIFALPATVHTLLWTQRHHQTSTPDVDYIHSDGSQYMATDEYRHEVERVERAREDRTEH